MELLNQSKEPRFRAELLIPHILLAAVLISLLIVSFIHYHIKYKRKAIHSHYHQEYLHHVTSADDASDVHLNSARLRSRRVSIPMMKVMRRYSQGHYPVANLLAERTLQEEENDVAAGRIRLSIGRIHTAPATISEQSSAGPSSPVYSEHDVVGSKSACSVTSVVDYDMMSSSVVRSPVADLPQTPAAMTVKYSLSKDTMTRLDLLDGDEVSL